jgi:hypothetical protein
VSRLSLFIAWWLVPEKVEVWHCTGHFHQNLWVDLSLDISLETKVGGEIDHLLMGRVAKTVVFLKPLQLAVFLI